MLQEAFKENRRIGAAVVAKESAPRWNVSRILADGWGTPKLG